MQQVIDVIRKQLEEFKSEECEIYGEFLTDNYISSVQLTQGSVYGFFVRLNDVDVQAVFSEATSKGANALKLISEFKPVVDDIYPLYWGKDKYIASRINKHISNPDGKAQGKKSGTGLIRLSAYNSLKGKSIYVFAIVVSDYEGFETELRSVYPDILKTKNSKI